jgi:hypothetical protein
MLFLPMEHPQTGMESLRCLEVSVEGGPVSSGIVMTCVVYQQEEVKTTDGHCLAKHGDH